MGIYEENIVPIKISRLAEYVASRKHIALFDALVYIYSNPLYQELYDERTKWWYLSTEALYDEFEIRRKIARKSVSNPAFEFFTYTLEKFTIREKIGGLQALALFKEYGADNFLLDNYDLLHTQGTEYVLDEVKEFIERRKRK